METALCSLRCSPYTVSWMPACALTVSKSAKEAVDEVMPKSVTLGLVERSRVGQIIPGFNPEFDCASSRSLTSAFASLNNRRSPGAGFFRRSSMIRSCHSGDKYLFGSRDRSCQKKIHCHEFFAVA